MNRYIFLFLIVCSSIANSDSKLLGKEEKDNEICSLFYDEDRYIWFPKGVFEREHITSKQSKFDGNNDGSVDFMFLRESLTTYQTNMMFYGSAVNHQEDFDYIFPQSWMSCEKSENCTLEDKMKNGVLNVGAVLKDGEEVRYRSRYTNVFPFVRKSSTYYKVTTESNYKDYVAIVKPHFNSPTFDVVCLFHTGKKL